MVNVAWVVLHRKSPRSQGTETDTRCALSGSISGAGKSIEIRHVRASSAIMKQACRQRLKSFTFPDLFLDDPSFSGKQSSHQTQQNKKLTSRGGSTNRYAPCLPQQEKKSSTKPACSDRPIGSAKPSQNRLRSKGTNSRHWLGATKVNWYGTCT